MKAIFRLFVALGFLLIVPCICTFSQVGINTDGASPDNTAMLDVKSTSKGLLVPRMTRSEIEAIVNPANGLFVFCTTNNKFFAYLSNISQWTEIAFGSTHISLGGSFLCGDPMTDTRDGKTYNTVQIGSQCWMAQNLNVGTMITFLNEQANNSIFEKYCYNDDEANCTIYGGLYQWAEMVQYYNGATNTNTWSPVPTGNIQGICPSGWHLPTDAEWNILISFLGGESEAGGEVKEAGFAHWASPNTGATNNTGFTALPGGIHSDGVGFSYLSLYSYLWSASELEENEEMAKNTGLFYDYEGMASQFSSKTIGLSARCLMD